MKNKKLVFIIIIMLVCAAALVLGIINSRSDNDIVEPESSEQTDTTVDEDQETIEKYLYVFEDFGYEKTAEGYQIATNKETVSSVRIVSASGNEMTIELHYDYKNGRNSEMKQFYKNEDEAVGVLASAFLTRVADAANLSEGNLTYTIYVGEDIARQGSMSLEEAYKYQELATE